MQIMEFITNWILYPMIVWFTIEYAKLSVTHELNKRDKLVYWLCITNILIRGLN